MPAATPRVLYVTDLAYEARGRRYCDEDIQLSSRLRRDFAVALSHPLDAGRLMGSFDAVMVRNSGPVLHYQEEYDAFRDRARAAGVRVYNPLTGRADMAGKQYLVELSAAGYPVIPTVDRAEDLGRLPRADMYVVKPKAGADSIGMEFIDAGRLSDVSFDGVLVQPRIPFRYEVSFYFIDRDFQYALYAPDPERRWELMPYEAGPAELAFARRFIEWNALEHGIQRVDACRAPDGELLLVELEDLNPYLSLESVADATREAFATRLTASLRELLR
ncbi:hypothetical protein OIE62_14340 [Streptomyces scopuliridis]|uniref:Uncharacterized protein n=1 Tax=Streptomyces scopuliridis TaxID=452529 RepID=A0ACD4ZR63_9ACTN|nr:hypothetical protein [Streptomyces scopuliridis]WSC00298.1 hypothetical protein OG835_27055 [Streptomyces scopuliridis]WSC06091.1 hypothetical protein OIE62_14340 [Streptomyces scopuliridis]